MDQEKRQADIYERLKNEVNGVLHELHVHVFQVELAALRGEIDERGVEEASRRLAQWFSDKMHSPVTRYVVQRVMCEALSAARAQEPKK